MADGTSTRLVLELSNPAPIPAGTLTRPDGTRASFDGWLQLLAALAAAFDALPDVDTNASPQ